MNGNSTMDTVLSWSLIIGMFYLAFKRSDSVEKKRSLLAESQKQAEKAQKDRARSLELEKESERRKKNHDAALVLANVLFKKHHTVVVRFLEIGKRKAIASRDDYGDENPAVIFEEAKRAVQKIAEKDSDFPKSETLTLGYGRSVDSLKGIAPVSSELISLLLSFYSENCKSKGNRVLSENDQFASMSGLEFEHYLMARLIAMGALEVRGTKATGDQGGDILFSIKGFNVVVQAKRYTGSVGNDSVQEVYAAKTYYSCDMAWVITTSEFTAHAKALAASLGVTLFDGTDLLSLEDRVLSVVNRQ